MRISHCARPNGICLALLKEEQWRARSEYLLPIQTRRHRPSITPVRRSGWLQLFSRFCSAQVHLAADTAAVTESRREICANLSSLSYAEQNACSPSPASWRTVGIGGAGDSG